MTVGRGDGHRDGQLPGVSVQRAGVGVYLQVKNWARAFKPGAILGVYTTDELQDSPPRERDITPRTAAEFAQQAKPQPSAAVDRDALLDRLDKIARSNAPAEKRLADLAKAWNDIGKDGRAAVGADELTRLEVPKTGSSKRVVKMLAPARQALEAQKAFTLLANGHVFHNPRTGQPWEGDQPIRKTMWQPALRRAGVRYRVPYQTRHTYASMMLSAGEHPMWVASQMGHADWGMIRRVYGRWMPDAAPDAGGKAEALYGGAAGQDLVNISPKTRINAG